MTKLEQEMKRKGWTKAKVAQAFGMDRTSIYRWFKGGGPEKREAYAISWLMVVEKANEYEGGSRSYDWGPKEEGVYLIRVGDRVKIGRTCRLWRRLASLQNGNPDRLAVIGWHPTEKSTELEAELHRMFKTTHIQGEWYLWCSEMREWANGEPEA